MKETWMMKKITIAVTAGIILLAGVYGLTRLYSNANTASPVEFSVLTEERAQFIDTSVKEAKKKLTQYSSAEPITALLRDTHNEELVDAAQSYTADFTQGIDGLECVCVTDPETCVLAHSEPSEVGKFTMVNSDIRQALFDAVSDADDNLYIGGVKASSRANEPVLFIYKGIFGENGEVLGYTRISLFAEPMLAVDAASVNGAASALLDVPTAMYMYHSDDSLNNSEAENAEIVDLCGKLSGKDQSESGTLKYQDGAGNHHAAYTYLPEYGWLYLLDTVS